MRALSLLALALTLSACATESRARRGGRRPRGAHAVRLRGCPVRAGGDFAREGVRRVASMAFDIGHVCVASNDGVVRCMGENTHGELGAQTRGQVLREPHAVRGFGRVEEVLVGRRITCGRRRDGTVRCIGSPEGGQLGTGAEATPTAEGTLLPVQNLRGATQLATGLGTVCALVDDGTLRCWGRDAEPVATPVPGITGLAEIDLEGVFHGCGRWGDGAVRCGRFLRTVDVRGATQLDAGSSHACARLADGTARCWGMNSSGQLGATTPPADLYTPVDPGLRCVTQLAVGGDHTCALVTDGTVRCWGGNHFGQLGDGTTSDRAQPVSVAGVSNAVRVFAGGGTSCALVDDGELLCWGQSLWLPGPLPPTMPRPRSVAWWPTE